MTEGLGATATISTGMLWQGVVNFGSFFGVLAAAFLMALWVAILARQDLKDEKTGRMLLFFIGCGETGGQCSSSLIRTYCHIGQMIACLILRNQALINEIV